MRCQGLGAPPLQPIAGPAHNAPNSVLEGRASELRRLFAEGGLDVDQAACSTAIMSTISLKYSRAASTRSLIFSSRVRSRS